LRARTNPTELTTAMGTKRADTRRAKSIVNPSGVKIRDPERLSRFVFEGRAGAPRRI
jgi:hypothetical protein